MFSFTKKRLALATSVASMATIGGIVAYAYFTTTGSGSGTATVGTSSDIAITGSTTGTLYPGTNEAVSFSANNPSPGHQKLGVIHLSAVKACTAPDTWDPTANSNAGGCTNSATEVSGCESLADGAAANDTTKNFWMADVAENQDLPSGVTNSAGLTVHTGTLYMNNLSSSQDACKSANLYLVFNAAAPAN